MEDDISAFRIQNVADLLAFAKEPSQEHVHFHITDLSTPQFGQFVQTLATNRHHLEQVRQITVQSNIRWNKIQAKDFMEILSVLPSLRGFAWNAGSPYDGIPIPALTILLTRCTKLEFLTLQSLSFLATHTTLQQLCQALKDHSHLRVFRCWGLTVTEMPETLNPSTSNHHRPILDTFVDEVLKALMFVTSLECIDMRVPGAEESNRALLGLCRHGTAAEMALEMFQQLLRENMPYSKIRLWIANGYKPTNNNNTQGILLELAPILARNTVVKDFRVRGNDELQVSKDVIDVYTEMLGSGENICLTNCDLMTKQGEQIDFYCRLNSMDRGTLMQQLQGMTRQEWVENILLRFSDDIDALFYWNRLHPVFFTANDYS